MSEFGRAKLSQIGDFISRIEVIYGDDKPYDTVNELTGGNADINGGHGGDYVWLKVHKATKPSELVSSIWTVHRESHIAGMSDLANGAGGMFRYLHMVHDMTVNKYVTDIALWRDGSHHDEVPHGWDGKTSDINDGRGGDFMYLVWKTKDYLGPMSD
ncbi:hypothetical protein Micbo1qcDRAFT_204461 [Microdochium bolleyi]|uniref:Uncharacterized protein n=1 Tax=Microdochium bolleyi TaxID=196109 RepID=A0A136J5L2_9PEZI|nr:hypothetical protein Micbo1qcDRAFT_204461 [Microdochium bolleyi]